MVQHTNFYETIQEARMRLDETIVLYDGLPYHLLTVCDHKPDGIFRVYLDPLTRDNSYPYHRHTHVPYTWMDEPGTSRGQAMDKWMETTEGKSSPILRKKMNSPKFNKFRPFPLGMINLGTYAAYLERSPTRHTQQGLTHAGMSATAFDLIPSKKRGLGSSGILSGSVKVPSSGQGLYDTIVGNYPSIDEVLTNLTDDTISNTSVAFDREFALVRGPVGLLFLAYRGEIVGYLPYNNTSEVKISNKFSYVKESVDELAKFTKIS